MSVVLVTRVGNRRLDPPVEMSLVIRGGGRGGWKGKVKHEPTKCESCGAVIEDGEQYVIEGWTYHYCVGCVDWCEEEQVPSSKG